MAQVSGDTEENHQTLKLANIKPKRLQDAKKTTSQYSASASASGKPRLNCLCSPTTHAGSFRCRHHRVAALTRGGSVGSTLGALLASKSGRFSDSLKAQ